MKDSLLVVGSIAFDDLEMPTGKFDDVLGGAATYSSIAASLLGQVRLVGVIGTDFAEAHLDRMRARGIDTAGVERVRADREFALRLGASARVRFLERFRIERQADAYEELYSRVCASHQGSENRAE